MLYTRLDLPTKIPRLRVIPLGSSQVGAHPEQEEAHEEIERSQVYVLRCFNVNYR